MDILSTLENLDSKAEKANVGLFKWVLPLAIGSIAAVALSWGFRAWREARANHAWDTFRMHVWARNGAVALVGDSGLASEQIRQATGVGWGDLASAIQSGSSFEPEEAVRALSVIRSSKPSTAAAVASLAFLAENGRNGLDALASRLEGMSGWLRARPNLSRNVVAEGSPAYAFATDSGVVEVALDPTIGDPLLAEIRKAVESGALDGIQANLIPSGQALELTPEAEAIRKFPDYQDLLARLNSANSSFSLFKGTLAVGRSKPEPDPISLHLFLNENLNLSRQFRSIGAIRKGEEILSSGSTGPQKKTSVKFVSVRPV